MANLTPLPSGTELPRFPLAVLPTPLVPAHRLQRAVGGPLVWVKRDDLIGFGTAGNKARPLELLLGDGLERGCDVLVTGGGPGSNFCAAAAAGARVAGIDCHLVVAGTAGSAHANLVAARTAGARLHFTGRDDREEIDVAVKTLAAELAAKGRRPLSLPRGGATALGAIAFAHAYEELHAQLAAAAVVAGVLVLATGSGGSQAGLVAGSTTRHIRRYTAVNVAWSLNDEDLTPRIGRLVGATVSRPPSQIHGTVRNLARSCVDRLGVPDGAPGPDAVEIVDARGPGFGIASEAGERAARLARETEGLLLDPVYTAKAFAVVLQLIEEGFDQPIIFWHTGGLPSALDHLRAAAPTAAPTTAPTAAPTAPTASNAAPTAIVERSPLCPT